MYLAGLAKKRMYYVFLYHNFIIYSYFLITETLDGLLDTILVVSFTTIYA